MGVSSHRDSPLDELATRFLLKEVESVPHLEALLLLCRDGSVRWRPADLAQRLYLTDEAVVDILADLHRRNLIDRSTDPEVSYAYHPANPDVQATIARVATLYRERLIDVTTLIHSKASPSVRAFANAFRFTKERK